MFGHRLALPVVVIAALALAAAPVALALDELVFDGDEKIVTIEGTVSGFVCCKAFLENDTDGCDCEECDDRAGAFILVDRYGAEHYVEFGPWWYWETQETTVRDVVTDEAVEQGHSISVKGEQHDKDGVLVLEAWTITNETTGEDITIKVEGCPPWAGGPEEYGVEPSPPSDEDGT